MARAVDITADEVVVRLSGLDVFAALKRTLRIPRAAIRAVSTARYEGDGLRLGGTAIPFTDIRAGRFRRGGRRTFVSFEHRGRVVTLTLDRRSNVADNSGSGAAGAVGVANLMLQKIRVS